MPFPRTSAAAGLAASLLVLAFFAGVLGADEPPTINPFGPVRQDRDDAVPGYLELSDGRVIVGNIYLTRDKRLKIEDRAKERQREVPLSAVRQIDCTVEKEWMEKEWRFKEAALNEKVFTGRTYPARVYSHTITLKNGKKITGPLAEIVYISPFVESADGPRANDQRPEPIRFLLNKRNKGAVGGELQSLRYVKSIKLGEDAVEEGKKKAAKSTSGGRKAEKEADRPQ